MLRMVYEYGPRIQMNIVRQVEVQQQYGDSNDVARINVNDMNNINATGIIFKHSVCEIDP